MSLSICRLDPSIPVETPKGRAECLAWFDYGKEEDLIWLCALDSDGSCWLIPNKDIRLCENYSIGRNFKKIDDICVCGHMKISHIREEGSCRPGFVCESQCKKYRNSYENIKEAFEVLDRGEKNDKSKEYFRK